MLQNDFVVETSLVGMVLNGLSHFHNIRDKAHFALCLIRGLGGNLNEKTQEKFANDVSMIIYWHICLESYEYISPTYLLLIDLTMGCSSLVRFINLFMILMFYEFKEHQ